ncbi:MAG: MGMT family protein [Fimbriimonadaceae bacterium]|nr:MGMT family protein [Fimbriimonadaceae bacterium]
MPESPTRDRALRVVSLIPPGRVAGYSDVGAQLMPRLSGLLIGRILTHPEPDTPWWRVVGRDGTLLVAKRDPQIAAEQRARLLSEGVDFLGEQVDMVAHALTPADWDLLLARVVHDAVDDRPDAM